MNALSAYLCSFDSKYGIFLVADDAFLLVEAGMAGFLHTVQQVLLYSVRFTSDMAPVLRNLVSPPGS